MPPDTGSGEAGNQAGSLSDVLKVLNQNDLMMDKDFVAPGPSADRYRLSSPALLPHGIMRNSPAAIINTQPTYFSERACATPMIPPSTSEFRSEMRERDALLDAYAQGPGDTPAQERHKKALNRAFRMRKERGYRLSSPSDVIVAEDPFHTPPVQKTPRRLKLSQPRPPPTSSENDENANEDDEDDGGNDLNDRGVGDPDAEGSEGTNDDDDSEESSMGNESDDDVPLDDWQPMLESDHIFLPSNLASQPQLPSKSEAIKPIVEVQDSDESESGIIDVEEHVGSDINIPSQEPPISETPAKKRKTVSFTGIATVENDNSSDLSSLNLDENDSDVEMLHSKPEPAPQTSQPIPKARRPIFIKKEVISPKPALPTVPTTTSNSRKRRQPVKEEVDDPSSEEVDEDDLFEAEEEDDEDDDDYEDYEDVEIGGAKRRRNGEGRFVKSAGSTSRTRRARKASKSYSSRQTSTRSKAPVQSQSQSQSTPASALSTAASPANSTTSSTPHSAGPRPFVPMSSRNSFTGDRIYHTMGPRVIQKNYFDKK